MLSHRLTSLHVRHVLKTCFFLLLFLLAFPLTGLITVVTLALRLFHPPTTVRNPHAKRILVSGAGMTKGLQLARLLHADGHQLVLTDEYAYTASRYSRCVSRFYVCGITDTPPEYIPSIVEIVKKEKIELFIPVSHSTCECTDALLTELLKPLGCETLHGDSDQLKMLSDKYEFIQRAQSFGLTVPKTIRITSPQQILNYDFSKEKRKFILKRLQYDSVTRATMKQIPCRTREETLAYVNSLEINEQYPWIMQEFIPGKEFCTHGTFRNGELRVYTCCQSSAWLLNYRHLANHAGIQRWVEEFCAKAKIHGQASFDFIEGEEDGLIYPLECNPRTHTAIVNFYNHTRVAEGYVGTEKLRDGPIQPKAQTREVYWLYHELWNCGKIRTAADLLAKVRLFWFGKEALYDFDDPIPFFLHYTYHMPRLLIFNLIHMTPFQKVDCNLSLLL